MSFRQKVLEVVKRIPAGSVMTYADVARAAGHPRAYRAVGSLMKANADSAVPCHRVVRSDGAAGEYNRGAGGKVRLLRSEGVRVFCGRIAMERK